MMGQMKKIIKRDEIHADTEVWLERKERLG
jgi:hypothetical protein